MTAKPFASPSTRPAGRGGFVGRHWRGEYGLGRSYWLHGILVLLVSPYAGVLLVLAASSIGVGMAANAVILLLATLVPWIWHGIGTWRAAHGKGGWAIFARAVLILPMVPLLLLNRSLYHAAMEEETAGRPKGASVRVVDGGRAIEINGAFGDSRAPDFQRALEQAPDATVVRLHSPGGRIDVADRIATAIRARNLDTHVSLLCESNCAFALLAGRNRTAMPTARISFSEPRTFDGEAQDKAARERVFTEMTRAGVAPDFIVAVLAKGYSKARQPTLQQLVEAGVLTGLVADDKR
jgi:hypothetical protein